MRAILYPTLLALLTACTTPADDTPERAATTDTAPAKNMLDERDNWQQPEHLILMLGPDIKGMTVADLFADDGYFTFKLIEAGANVIAIENDREKVARLEERKRELGLGDDRLRIRAVPVGDPGLGAEEADVALMTHRYTTIRDRRSYITRLRQGLREPRPLFIIEWQRRETPIGPPLEERMNPEEIMDELGEWGYSDIGAHSAKMPYQVIMLATDPMELPDELYEQLMGDVELVPL